MGNVKKFGLRDIFSSNLLRFLKRYYFWGRALSGVITVLEDRGYMITVREKMNNIKKVAKFYNYDFLATTSHQLPPVLDKSRT